MTTQTEKAIVVKQPTPSERFTAMVAKEFNAAVGDTIELSPLQRRLAQHLYIKLDTSLKAAETKRLDKGGKPDDGRAITWQNINMQRLALDAMHRIDLGLDALIPNHISPIPYFNIREGKFDIDLRVGYVGKDYYRREMAMEKPVDIIYELVYSKDKFAPKKKSLTNEIETYEFEIPSPFDRGEVVGGFGYIMYEDSRKNKLVVCTEKDFIKSKNIAKASEFWEKWPVEMRLKTLVHRVTDKLGIDPKKVNESYAAVEEADSEVALADEIAQNANKTPIDLQTGEITEQQPAGAQSATSQGEDQASKAKAEPEF